MHNLREKIKLGLLLLAAGVFFGSQGCALIGGTGERIRHAKGYSTVPLSGWQTKDPQDADVAYRLASGALATLVSSCGPNSNAPLSVLARQLLFGLRDITVEVREQRQYGDVRGLYTKANGTISGTRLYLELFTTVQNECVFDFSLISPRAIAAGEQKEFFSYIKSLRYGKD